MNLEAFRRGLLRVSISGARLDPDRGLPRWAVLLSKDAPPLGKSKATVQFRSAVDEIKP